LSHIEQAFDQQMLFKSSPYFVFKTE